MGKYDLGITLSQRCSAWLRASGKTSILQTRGQNISNVSTCGLKYNRALANDMLQIRKRNIKFINGSQAGAGETQIIATNNSGEYLGNIVFSSRKLSKATYNFPQNYKDANENLLAHIHIDSLSSAHIQKGTGTALLQEAVKESIKQGYGGRIVLDAGAIGNGITRSPLPFYFKMGLRCCNENNDKVFRKLPPEILDKLHTTSIQFGGIGAQKMYLPVENISRLLSM